MNLDIGKQQVSKNKVYLTSNKIKHAYNSYTQVYNSFFFKNLQTKLRI